MEEKIMPILNTKNMDEEIEKLVEEVIEFIDAYDDDNCIEEFYDVLQVMINIMNMKGILYKMNTGLEDHIKKLEGRGWNIKEWI